MERSSSSTSTIETATRTDPHGPTSTSHPLMIAPSSHQIPSWDSSREPTNSSPHMCIFTTTTPSQVSTSTTPILLDSMPASSSRRRWPERKTSRRAAGTPSTSSSVTWRRHPRSATASFQQSWWQLTPSQQLLARWILREVQQRALRRCTPFPTSSKMTTPTCTIWQFADEWSNQMKKLSETTFKKAILRSKDRSRTLADSSRSIWARTRSWSSRPN